MAELAAPAFYFDPATTRIDWESSATLVTVNPEWLRRDAKGLDESLTALPALTGHLWVATSGSSGTVPGHARWVALAKQAFLASARAVNAHLQSGQSDVWAHALPVFHVGGLGILARAWLSGASIEPAVFGRWDAWRFHARLLETRATLTALVPSQLHDLVGTRLRAPESLRAIVVGGARLDPELCADARLLGWRCLPSYGLTESCSQVATAALETGLSDVCDGPLPVLQHAALRSDEEERLHIRASSLLTCYAEMTAEGMQVRDPKVDGWLETEDLGRVTPEGVQVLGRATESVKVLGETVSVLRVEEVVRRWVRALAPPSDDLDAAVIALPHPRLGHELVAVLAPPAADSCVESGFSRTRDGSSSYVESGFSRIPDDLLPSLLAFARDTLLPYERPQRIVRVARIPRTALGKCQRALLAREVGLEPGTNG